MSVKKEASGRRTVINEIEVPGTPEEVWQAIATGPGVSSWFMPTTFEEQGGRPVAEISTFGPGMAARSTVTAWDPPRTFTVQGESWAGAPPVAIEWQVEARSGGVCIVRAVNSLFSSTDDWDDQLEATASAWPSFFRTLQLYLAHFRGQRSKVMSFAVPAAGTEPDAWRRWMTAFGLAGAGVGQAWTAPSTAPTLGGVVAYASEVPNDLLVRLDKPVPGIAAFGSYDMGSQVMVAVNFYQYGDHADETVARETPVWQAWLDEHFPPAPAPSSS